MAARFYNKGRPNAAISEQCHNRRRIILVLYLSTRVSVPSSECAPPAPLCAPSPQCPTEPKRAAPLPCGWGGDGSQFGRLERKPGTLYTLLLQRLHHSRPKIVSRCTLPLKLLTQKTIESDGKSVVNNLNSSEFDFDSQISFIYIEIWFCWAMKNSEQFGIIKQNTLEL